MRGLSLVVASGGHSSSRCAGLSLSRPLLLRSTGSRCAGSVIVAHGPICSVACGIFPDQGSNPCLLHWQADSQPLRHQGSPLETFLFVMAKDATGIWWVEARDTAKHLTIHRTAPYNKQLSGPSATGAEVEKPCFKVNPIKEYDTLHLPFRSQARAIWIFLSSSALLQPVWFC